MAFRAVRTAVPAVKSNACIARHASSGVPLRHVKKFTDFTREEVFTILARADDIKANPSKYQNSLDRKVLLMYFEKPSLRTRISFETGMFQMGGHAIAYMNGDSPIGSKETVEDFAQVVSRYVNVVLARVKLRRTINKLCENATIPIVNGLDDYAHPCQILSDMQTIKEKKGGFDGLKLAFVGDCQNNMTYDLARAASLLGFTMYCGGPREADFQMEQPVLDEIKQLGGDVVITDSAEVACKDADVVYADSWMSYHVSQELRASRFNQLLPFQVTEELMSVAKKDCVFMNCLPAMRGEEQTAEVVDGPQSIVFDQAENRLHAQKALLFSLLRGFDASP